MLSRHCGIRPALIPLFAKKFFRAVCLQIVGGHRPPLQGDTNELDRTNILAPGFWLRKAHLLPAFTPENFRGLALGSRIQLQQRNCSRFARDFSRRSTFSSSQRTESISSGLRFAAQDLFINRASIKRIQPCPRPILLLIVLLPVAPDSSAPISPSRCRKNFPRQN